MSGQNSRVENRLFHGVTRPKTEINYKNKEVKKMYEQTYNSFPVFQNYRIKELGEGEDKKYKHIFINVFGGAESIMNSLPDLKRKRRYSEKNTINDEKLENNLIRAKSKIYELSYCNNFEYFVTFTLSPDKNDRYDLNKSNERIDQFLRYHGKKTGIKFEKLLIPEMHEDEAWHFHGLLTGIPFEELELFTLKDKLPYKLRKRIRAGEKLYNWLPYANKFGHVVISPVRSKEAISNYITKYINKNIMRSVKEMGAHTYYPSQGLKKSKLIYDNIYDNFKYANSVPEHLPSLYGNDYVKVCTTDYITDDLNYIDEIEEYNEFKNRYGKQVENIDITEFKRYRKLKENENIEDILPIIEKVKFINENKKTAHGGNKITNINENSDKKILPYETQDNSFTKKELDKNITKKNYYSENDNIKIEELQAKYNNETNLTDITVNNTVNEEYVQLSFPAEKHIDGGEQYDNKYSSDGISSGTADTG